MLKIKDLRDEIIAFLTEKLPDYDIKAGRNNEFAVVPPGIMVFIEPGGDNLKNSNLHPVFRKAKVLLFSAVNSEESASDSSCLAVAMLEEVEEYILNYQLQEYLSASAKNINGYKTNIEYPDNWIGFEGYFNNTAVASLELIIDYCAFFGTTS